MAAWRTMSLGEVSQNHDARRVPVREADRKSGPYPYYGASGVVDHVDSYLFEGLHLLVAEDGENLRTRKLPIAFLASGRFWVNNHAHILTGNHLSDTRFLCYALSIADVGSYLSGSTMPKLTQGNLARIPIRLPELAEQRQIVGLLGALDDKIELNRLMNETLEASARELFRDWFVDFGPTRAKAEGRPAYLAPDLWSLFPDRLGVDGAPEGWSVYTLGDLADQHTGSIDPAKNGDEVFEHYSLPAFDNGASPSLDRGDTIKSNKTLLPAGAVLLSKLNPEISRVWMPTSAKDAKQVASTEFLAFVPKAPAGRSLLFAMFRDATFRQIMEGMVTGTSKSHQRISPPALRTVNALTGTPAIFQAFERFASPIMEQMLANRLASRSLAGTRDALLPKLMSGKIRVAEAESQASTLL